MRLEHLTEVKPVRKPDLLGHDVNAVVFLQQLVIRDGTLN